MHGLTTVIIFLVMGYPVSLLRDYSDRISCDGVYVGVAFGFGLAAYAIYFLYNLSKIEG